MTDPQVRMTLWPAVPFPLPPFTPRRADYRLHESNLAVIGSGDWFFELDRRARLGEVYLELYSLDLNDPSAIVAFAKRYGTVSGALVHSMLANYSWFFGLFSPSEDAKAREELVERDPNLGWIEATESGSQATEITTLASFRFAAGILHDLTDAWRIVKSDPDVETSSHEWQLRYQVHGGPTHIRLFALQLLTTGLTALLARFHPYLAPTLAFDLGSEDDGEIETNSPVGGVHAEAARSLPFVHLAEYCALELFNHIARSEVYRRCENCGRVFVRHYGRAAQGQTRREGIKYCDRYCAQAHATRTYRQRKKAKTRKG